MCIYIYSLIIARLNCFQPPLVIRISKSALMNTPTHTQQNGPKIKTVMLSTERMEQLYGQNAKCQFLIQINILHTPATIFQESHQQSVAQQKWQHSHINTWHTNFHNSFLCFDSLRNNPNDQQLVNKQSLMPDQGIVSSIKGSFSMLKNNVRMNLKTIMSKSEKASNTKDHILYDSIYKKV